MRLNTKRIMGTIAYMGGVPALLEGFAWAWSQLVEYNADYLCGPSDRICYTRAKVSDHAFARSMLAAQMQGDWLLMLDTDHQFEPDLAARMVRIFEQNDLDVLSGLYHYKMPPHPPVWFMRTPKGELGYLGQWDVPEGGGPYLVPIASAGGGCLLIRRRVFQRIEQELHEQSFGHRGSFSEDHSFFDRCRELGIQAYGCPMIESPHLMSRVVQMRDYTPDPTQLGERVAWPPS